MAFATRLCGIAIAALRIFSVDDGWRTSQIPKANIIAQSITIFDFIKAVCNNDYAPLRAIQYYGSQLLNDGDIAVVKVGGRSVKVRMR